MNLCKAMLLWIVCCVSILAQSAIYNSNNLHKSFNLSIKEIQEFSQLAGISLLTSSLGRQIQKPNIIAIASFYNSADFRIDSLLLMRTFLQIFKDSDTFIFANTVSENIVPEDSLLRKIYQIRNNKEFVKIASHDSSLIPQYSLNASISSTIQRLHTLNIIEYKLVLYITNTTNGLVEWEYTKQYQKKSDIKIPNNFTEESRYGLMCSQRIQGNMALREACELAISEIWRNDCTNIPFTKIPLITFYAKKACDLNSAFGCRIYGMSYHYGIGNKKNSQEALKLYTQACYEGDGKSCYTAALFYRNKPKVIRDFDIESRLFKESCDLGFHKACSKLVE